MHCFVSILKFAIILKRKRKLAVFAIIVLRRYCYYKVSVALPQDTVAWSAVCDCGNSYHSHLPFESKSVTVKQFKASPIIYKIRYLITKQ